MGTKIICYVYYESFFETDDTEKKSWTDDYDSQEEFEKYNKDCIVIYCVDK